VRTWVAPGGGGGGSGTVTIVSVVSANGFAGSVATPGTTPAITISTSISGLLKGDGTAISAASSGDVISVLGYTPVSTARTLTINGTTQDLSANRTWALTTSDIAEGSNLYFTGARVLATTLAGLSISGGSITSSDPILQAFGKLQNQINSIVGGGGFQAVWNASTNSPALASGVGTKGNYYVVSVAGSTNLDGITDWQIGDWAIFNGTAWNKVDNTDAISSFNGSLGAITYTPTGTANRIVVTGAAGLAPTFDIGTDVVTLTDTQTLTNKTLQASTWTSGATFSSGAISAALGTSIDVVNGPGTFFKITSSGNDLLRFGAAVSTVSFRILTQSGEAIMDLVGSGNANMRFNTLGTGFFHFADGKELRLFNSGNTFYTGFVSANTTSVTYTLPVADGTSGQVLSTNGSGILSWVTGGGGGGDMLLGTDQTVTAAKRYQTGTLFVFNPANTFQYSILGSAITANRNITMPLIAANDTFAVLGLAQSFSATQSFSVTGSATVPAISLSGSTMRWISFGSLVGTGSPTFTNRSAGTKIVLAEAIGPSTVDAAIGYVGAASSIWFSTPTAAFHSFLWYGGTTVALTLTGAGIMTLVGSLNLRAGGTTANTAPIYFGTAGNLLATLVNGAMEADGSRVYFTFNSRREPLNNTYMQLTGSGTGSATTISFAHGMTGVTGATPFVIIATNAAAGGFDFATIDATNINVTYAVAPASGTNNLSFNVAIR